LPRRKPLSILNNGSINTHDSPLAGVALPYFLHAPHRPGEKTFLALLKKQTKPYFSFSSPRFLSSPLVIVTSTPS